MEKKQEVKVNMKYLIMLEDTYLRNVIALVKNVDGIR